MMPIPESATQNGFLRLPEAEMFILLKLCLCGIERKSLGIFHLEVKQRFLRRVWVRVFNEEVIRDLPPKPPRAPKGNLLLFFGDLCVSVVNPRP